MRYYTNTVMVDFKHFSDWDLFGLGKSKYSFSETIFDTLIEWETGVYYDPKYFIEEYKDTAIEELKKQGYTDKQINMHNDTLESDILRACNDSMMQSIETAIYKMYEEKAENPDFAFSDFEYLDAGEKVVENFHEASYVRYGFSKKLWKEVIFDERPDYISDVTQTSMFNDSEEDLDDYVHENINPLTTGNHGDFDYIQESADCDNFVVMFNDYNETSHEIDEHNADKQKRIKAMIQNHVSLLDRQQELEALDSWV